MVPKLVIGLDLLQKNSFPKRVSKKVCQLVKKLTYFFETSFEASFEKIFIRRVRSSVSCIMYELGNKYKNYYRITDMSFRKLHDMLKDEINC